MKLVIDHLTRYGYDEEVKFSTQYLRLTPRSSGRQKITAWTLTLPDGSAVATTDAWGNVLHVLTLDNPHKEITIRASGIVDIAEEGTISVRSRRSCCRRWFSCAVRRLPAPTARSANSLSAGISRRRRRRA
jgi:transglutaminase-like putative cysteine protease